LSILGSSSKGIHRSTESRHVYLSPTPSVHRQGPNTLYMYTQLTRNFIFGILNITYV